MARTNLTSNIFKNGTPFKEVVYESPQKRSVLPRIKPKKRRKKKKVSTSSDEDLQTPSDEEDSPLVIKMARNPLRPGTQPMDTIYTRTMMRSELRMLVVIQVHPDDLLEWLFPDISLPVSLDLLLKELSKAQPRGKARYDPNGLRKWVDIPELSPEIDPFSSAEEEMAVYLQSITDFAKTLFHRQPDAIRKWTGRYATMHVLSILSGIRRKPDIILVKDHVDVDNKNTRIGWPFVESSLEGKIPKKDFSPDKFVQKVTPELDDRAFGAFEGQENRRHYPCGAVVGSTCRVSVYDRGGVAHSTGFNIHQRPKTFLRLVIGLSFASDTRLGYDCTIRNEVIPSNHPYADTLYDQNYKDGEIDMDALPHTDSVLEELAESVDRLGIKEAVPAISPENSPSSASANQTAQVKNWANILRHKPTPVASTSFSDATRKKQKKNQAKKRSKARKKLLQKLNPSSLQLSAADRPKNSMRIITIKDLDYIIKGAIFRRIMVQGRATQCWYVICDGEVYTVRDHWIVPGRSPTGVDLLRIANEAQVENIPVLVDWEDVMIEGKLDSCENNRGPHLRLVNRKHRREVFKGHCVPIFFFRSLRELISAFRDYLIAHKGLYLIKILHRDIHILNLMLDDSTAMIRKGVLIDIDYAEDFDKERMKLYRGSSDDKSDAPKRKEVATGEVVAVRSEPITVAPVPTATPVKPLQAAEAPIPVEIEASFQNTTPADEAHPVVLTGKIRRGEELERMTKRLAGVSKLLRGGRTGNQTFMSGELLGPKFVKHTFRHDFESFDYNLIYLSMMFQGPDDDQISGTIPAIIDAWIHPERMDAEVAGMAKIGWFALSDEALEEKLESVTEYMKPIIPLLKEIHKFLGGPKEEIDHDAFIKIFDWALVALDLGDGVIPIATPLPSEARSAARHQKNNAVPPSASADVISATTAAPSGSAERHSSAIDEASDISYTFGADDSFRFFNPIQYPQADSNVADSPSLPPTRTPAPIAGSTSKRCYTPMRVDGRDTRTPTYSPNTNRSASLGTVSLIPLSEREIKKQAAIRERTKRLMEYKRRGLAKLASSSRTIGAISSSKTAGISSSKTGGPAGASSSRTIGTSGASSSKTGGAGGASSSKTGRAGGASSSNTGRAGGASSSSTGRAGGASLSSTGGAGGASLSSTGGVGGASSSSTGGVGGASSSKTGQLGGALSSRTVRTAGTSSSKTVGAAGASSSKAQSMNISSSKKSVPDTLKPPPHTLPSESSGSSSRKGKERAPLDPIDEVSQEHPDPPSRKGKEKATE